MAERIQAPVGQFMDDGGKFRKRGRSREEGVVDGIAEQGHGERQAVGVGPAVAAGAGHDPHLAGPDGEPAGVEVLPQRDGDLPVGVPGHLDDVPFVAHQLQAPFEALLGGRTVDHDVTVGEGVVGVREFDAECFGEGALRRIDVDQLEPLQRKGAQQGGHHAADQAGADDGHAVTQPGPGFPQGVDGGFHGSGEHCPPGRDVLRDHGQGLDRDNVAVLVRVQAEHRAPHPFLRARLHGSHGEVAVLHRRREGTLLQRRPHLFGNPGRHVAAVDHRFGALADTRVEGTDQRFAGARRGQVLAPEFAFFVADGPIGPGLGVLLGIDHLAYESSPRRGRGEDSDTGAPSFWEASHAPVTYSGW